MSNQRRIVKVFLASPGDLQVERKLAKDVVDEFNNLWADNLGYQVDLIGWEETVASYGRPQSTINLDLAQCELVIGMMWKKWGTQPDIGGVYTSGFEEEFRTSVESRERSGKPEISLYFKVVGAEFLADPGEDLKKVISFKEEIIRGKSIYFENFEGESEFQSKILRCITRYVQKLRESEASAFRALSEVVVEPKADLPALTALGDSSRFLPEETEFLKAISDPALSAVTLSTLEVARFRLIAISQHRQGNDELNLGVHDANIIFANKDLLKLGRNEIFALMQCGLSNVKSENVPLWHWVSKSFRIEILPLWSRSGPKSERANAIYAMCAVSFSIPDDEREKTVSSWLSDKSPDDVKVEALRYLARCGVKSDLVRVEAEVSRSSYKTRSEAIRCYIAISVRYGFDYALKAILRIKNEDISYTFLGEFLEKSDILSDASLLEGLSHSSSGVRRISSIILRRRGLLPAEAAERLLSDDDAETRYEAIMALRSHGIAFSESDARKALIKPRIPFGAIFTRRQRQDEEGERVFERFRNDLLQEMSATQLMEEVGSPRQKECAAYLNWVQRSWSERSDTLKLNIGNRFSDFVNDLIERAIKINGAGSIGAAALSDSRMEMQRRFTRQALDTLSRRKIRSDIVFIRSEMDKNDIEFSEIDVEYFHKWGEWEDIERIIASISRDGSDRSLSLLSMGRVRIDYDKIGKAIYRIGAGRLKELLLKELHADIRSSIIDSSSKTQFSSLSDEDIESLLNDESIRVRKHACLKAIRSLSKVRLSNLIEKYLKKESYRYYNVVYWLDLGISLNRSWLTLACDNALQDEKLNGWQA